MTHPIQATVYFDYMCPYAYRIVRLFTEMEQTRPNLSVDWRFFSMEQIAAPKRGKDETWKLWDQPLYYPTLWRRPRSRMLPAFLASHAAQMQGPEPFARFRLGVYRAYHDDELDTSDFGVLLTIARKAGLDLNHLQAHWKSAAGRERLETDHQSGLRAGAFGIPTVIVNDCEATYLRLAYYPDDPQERQEFFDELLHALTQRDYLQEFKRAGAA